MRAAALLLLITIAGPAPTPLSAAAQEARGDAGALAGALASADAAERERAIAALAARGPSAIPAVLESIVANAARTRPEVEPWFPATVEVFRRMGRPAVLPLGQALEDPRRLWQAVAAAALAELGADAAPVMAQLGRALDREPAIAMSAEHALRNVGQPAVPVLVRALASSEGARTRAMRLLAEMGRTADPAVQAALAGLPPRTRAQLAFDAAENYHDPAQSKDVAGLYERALALAADGGADQAMRDIARSSLERLVGLYTGLGDEKAAAPHAARLLELHPGEKTTVELVGGFHARFGRVDVAEAMYRARYDRLRDAESCTELAAFFYKPHGEGGSRARDAVAALEACAAAAPANAELRHRLATILWDWAYRDTTLDDRARAPIVEKGLAAADAALALKPDYFEAVIYRALLIRIKAQLQTDPAARQKLIDEAAALQKRALELKKRQQAQAP